MNKEDLLGGFLESSSQTFGLGSFIVNLILTFILSSILGYFYTKYGKSLSNRRFFSNTFVIVSMSTMIIINIVKSSLALSLGLVGALSIVRFRTALKEPEELGFIFLSVAIGLGFGANKVLITIVGSIITCIAIFIKYRYSYQKKDCSINLLLEAANSDSIEVDDLLRIIESKASSLNMQRLSDGVSQFELALNVNLEDYNKSEIIGISSGASVPDILVKEVVDKFEEHFNVYIENVIYGEENVSFKLPKELRK